MGAVTASPEAVAPPCAPRLRGLGFLRTTPASAEPPPLPRARSPGSDTSRRRPPTSTMTVWRGWFSSSSISPPPVNGSTVLFHSVSIQRVCTVKPFSSPMKAGSLTTARWNGITVARPSTLNSSRARRARSNACARVAPLTISLASIESNWPPITEPLSTPESSRTPGPVGGSNLVTGPGAGRNPRPASSPLMRNSIECPRGTGSAVIASFSPLAMRNCSRTRSIPEVSSVTGCSTCRRVFTSRKEIRPSWPTRYSTVPAP